MVKPRYAYVMTGHIFYDNGPDETVRYIYDTVEDKIVEADVLRSLGWKALGASQCYDILECVQQHGLAELSDVAEVDMFDELVTWE